MTPHPLDPLSPDELAAAIEIVRREQGLNQNHLFVFTLLDEPTKDVLNAWKTGDPIDRAARITIWDRAEGLLIESVVGLDGTVRRWEPQPGQKAALLGPEAVECIGVIFAKGVEAFGQDVPVPRFARKAGHHAILKALARELQIGKVGRTKSVGKKRVVIIEAEEVEHPVAL